MSELLRPQKAALSWAGIFVRGRGEYALEGSLPPIEWLRSKTIRPPKPQHAKRKKASRKGTPDKRRIEQNYFLLSGASAPCSNTL